MEKAQKIIDLHKESIEKMKETMAKIVRIKAKSIISSDLSHEQILNSGCEAREYETPEIVRIKNLIVNQYERSRIPNISHALAEGGCEAYEIIMSKLFVYGGSILKKFLIEQSYNFISRKSLIYLLCADHDIYPKNKASKILSMNSRITPAEMIDLESLTLFDVDQIIISISILLATKWSDIKADLFDIMDSVPNNFEEKVLALTAECAPSTYHSIRLKDSLLSTIEGDKEYDEAREGKEIINNALLSQENAKYRKQICTILGIDDFGIESPIDFTSPDKMFLKRPGGYLSIIAMLTIELARIAGSITEEDRTIIKIYDNKFPQGTKNARLITKGVSSGYLWTQLSGMFYLDHEDGDGRLLLRHCPTDPVQKFIKKIEDYRYKNSERYVKTETKKEEEEPIEFFQKNDTLDSDQEDQVLIECLKEKDELGLFQKKQRSVTEENFTHDCRQFITLVKKGSEAKLEYDNFKLLSGLKIPIPHVFEVNCKAENPDDYYIRVEKLNDESHWLIMDSGRGSIENFFKVAKNKKELLEEFMKYSRLLIKNFNFDPDRELSFRRVMGIRINKDNKHGELYFVDLDHVSLKKHSQ